MALELRNRLESEAQLKLSATLAFNYPTVAALAAHLADRMELPLDAADEAQVSRPVDPAGDATVEPSDGEADERAATDASDEDVESMLADELAAVERLLDSDTRWP
jgi:hypothetical protein